MLLVYALKVLLNSSLQPFVFTSVSAFWFCCWGHCCSNCLGPCFIFFLLFYHCVHCLRHFKSSTSVASCPVNVLLASVTMSHYMLCFVLFSVLCSVFEWGEQEKQLQHRVFCFFLFLWLVKVRGISYLIC